MRGHYVYRARHGGVGVSLIEHNGLYGLMVSPGARLWTADPVEALHQTADAVAMLEGRTPHRGEGATRAPGARVRFLMVRHHQGRLQAYLNTGASHRDGVSLVVDADAEVALRQVADEVQRRAACDLEPVGPVRAPR